VSVTVNIKPSELPQAIKAVLTRREAAGLPLPTETWERDTPVPAMIAPANAPAARRPAGYWGNEENVLNGFRLYLDECAERGVEPRSLDYQQKSKGNRNMAKLSGLQDKFDDREFEDWVALARATAS